MATQNMTLKSFEQTIEKSDIVLIDFWAAWCGPCRMFGPIFEEASEKHEDIVFAKVDTEAEQNLAAVFGIRSIPTLAVFREGIMVFRQAGALPAEALAELVQQVRDLDMDDVRAKVAEAEATEQPN